MPIFLIISIPVKIYEGANDVCEAFEACQMLFYYDPLLCMRLPDTNLFKFRKLCLHVNLP